MASPPTLHSLAASHPLIRQRLATSITGLLLGTAYADALGLYTEFLPAAVLPTLYPAPIVLSATPFHADTHRLKFTPGSWTDDTDHALLLTLSILHHNGQVDPQDFAIRLRNWCEQGLRVLDRLPLGRGQTTTKVCLQADFSTDAAKAATRVWESQGKKGAANGSVMRTAVLGVFCADLSEREAADVARRVSMVTHPDPRAVWACAVVTALARGLLRGEVVDEDGIDALLGRIARDGVEESEAVKHTTAKSLQELELDDSLKMGYCLKALGCGVLQLRKALRGGRRFDELVREVVMMGGDADTNGAVVGALLGVWYGADAVPDGVKDEGWLRSVAQRACIVAGAVEGSYDGKGDPETTLDGGKGFLGKEEMEKREQSVLKRVLEGRLRTKDEKEKEGWWRTVSAWARTGV